MSPSQTRGASGLEVSSDCSVVAPAGGGVGAASPGPHRTPRGFTELLF